MNTRTIATGVLALGLITSSAVAYGGGKHHGDRGMHHFIGAVHDLELTDEQWKQLRAMKKEKRSQMKEARAKVQPIPLETYISAEGFKKTEYQLALTERITTKTAHEAEAIEKVLNVLTPEQRTELAANLAKARK